MEGIKVGEGRAQRTVMMVHKWCDGGNLRGLHLRGEIKYCTEMKNNVRK